VKTTGNVLISFYSDSGLSSQISTGSLAISDTSLSKGTITLTTFKPVDVANEFPSKTGVIYAVEFTP
jgi:hypothetical protein